MTALEVFKGCVAHEAGDCDADCGCSDDGYCELDEASESSPCASTCYFAPCRHGLKFGCKAACANCPEPCSSHHGISPRTGEIYLGCMGPDGESSETCPCDAFVERAGEGG